jgi:Tol biopolymer transport system component
MNGDFILQARAAFLGIGSGGAVENASAGETKLGWTVRSSLAEDSPAVSVVLHEDGRVTLQIDGQDRSDVELRRPDGRSPEDVRSSSFTALTAADVLQLERRGNRYRASAARFGEPFVSKEIDGVDLGDEVYVALFVSQNEQAYFDNVRIIVPAPEDYVFSYISRDLLGSQLEILDVVSGQRRTIYSSALPFEAPNWTPDGKALIYNSGGRLYRFDLAGRTPEVIDTGFATHNNNDHLLSFDGTMLGISHHSEQDGGNAIVYVLPVNGGTPRRVTERGPSYLHGWSPDGRFLAYTGMRDGSAEIYRIGIDGGDETRLTSAPGLNDGPEYTPDGHYIYFNSERSGRMQIWRMRPDGSEQQQVTDDEYNNWFAHISPDGQRIIFLSYGQDVAPGDHPPYKHVYLRMMPAGGAPRVVAYVYGGQGTINVPSWSPDSTQLAFVSNTRTRD